ncbi:MAG: hypothetical protein QS98_C0003G0069 [archaeon GW2011_AR3]|nr:MAG: hypothetical protein QS98_C0003G0069 [archaeon GW2011_AR3]MBS3110111.1 hypothetical protein [Candidatus Woesearchaeota archaeon]
MSIDDIAEPSTPETKESLMDYIRIGGRSQPFQLKYLREKGVDNGDFYQTNKYTLASIAASAASIGLFYALPINWAALPIIGPAMPYIRMYFNYIRLPVLAFRSLYVTLIKKPIGKIVPSIESLARNIAMGIYKGISAALSSKSLKPEYSRVAQAN